MIRCDGCGASNPASAAWCGQCYAPLVSAGVPERVDRDRQPSAGTPVDGGAGDPTSQVPAGAVTAAGAASAEVMDAGVDPAAGADSPALRRAGFRRLPDGRLQWSCPQCASDNDLDATACAVCGTGFAERFRSPPPPTPAPGAWPAALAMSAVAPGAGHVYLHRPGTGAARLLLYAVWLSGGLLLVRTGGLQRAGLPAGALLAGATVLWAGTMLDLLRLRAGQRQLLEGRPLLWLVVAVLGASLLGVFTSLRPA